MLIGRFHALAGAHALVRRNFSPHDTSPQVSDLAELLRDTVERQFNGSLNHTWNADGLLLEIRMPVKAIEY